MAPQAGISPWHPRPAARQPAIRGAAPTPFPTRQPAPAIQGHTPQGSRGRCAQSGASATRVASAHGHTLAQPQRHPPGHGSLPGTGRARTPAGIAAGRLRHLSQRGLAFGGERPGPPRRDRHRGAGPHRPPAADGDQVRRRAAARRRTLQALQQPRARRAPPAGRAARRAPAPPQGSRPACLREPLPGAARLPAGDRRHRGPVARPDHRRRRLPLPGHPRAGTDAPWRLAKRHRGAAPLPVQRIPGLGGSIRPGPAAATHHPAPGRRTGHLGAAHPGTQRPDPHPGHGRLRQDPAGAAPAQRFRHPGWPCAVRVLQPLAGRPHQPAGPARGGRDQLFRAVRDLLPAQLRRARLCRPGQLRPAGARLLRIGRGMEAHLRPDRHRRGAGLPARLGREPAAAAEGLRTALPAGRRRAAPV